MTFSSTRTESAKSSEWALSFCDFYPIHRGDLPRVFLFKIETSIQLDISVQMDGHRIAMQVVKGRTVCAAGGYYLCFENPLHFSF
jgi:hypothetical protein